ncbi:carboxypeptidase-like regulatory domain-containing protein [Flectobacillus major]|uniref:carboxypeptidase-like regulatory domain-containing protein n=1 Tax=Flectobacillus major TaxID=103 RepID=UPI000427C0D5|nr:carboxypeptidase-like regulatory domain-containing protein [Flectobacillus major]
MNKALVFICLLITHLSFGQTSSFRGSIIDQQTGEPLVGATVRLEKKGGYDVAGLDGSFSIKNIPYGK